MLLGNNETSGRHSAWFWGGSRSLPVRNSCQLRRRGCCKAPEGLCSPSEERPISLQTSWHPEKTKVNKSRAASLRLGWLDCADCCSSMADDYGSPLHSQLATFIKWPVCLVQNQFGPHLSQPVSNQIKPPQKPDTNHK